MSDDNDFPQNPVFNPVAWVIGIGLWLLMIYAVLRVGQFLEIWP